VCHNHAASHVECEKKVLSLAPPVVVSRRENIRPSGAASHFCQYARTFLLLAFQSEQMGDWQRGGRFQPLSFDLDPKRFLSAKRFERFERFALRDCHAVSQVSPTTSQLILFAARHSDCCSLSLAQSGRRPTVGIISDARIQARIESTVTHESSSTDSLSRNSKHKGSIFDIVVSWHG